MANHEEAAPEWRKRARQARLRKRRVVRLEVQRLEPRCVPATITYTAPRGTTPGLVSIIGGDGNDRLTLSTRDVQRESQLILNDGGRNRIVARARRTANPFRNVSVVMQGGAGNDQLTNATKLPSVLDGGPGNDKLVGGSGNDTFRWNGIGTETIAGGRGVNRLEQSFAYVGNLEYFEATVEVTDTVITSLVFENVVGAEYGYGKRGTARMTRVDLIQVSGTPFNDVINAEKATKRVVLFGLEGDDELRGGSGSDSLHSGAGKYIMAGGAGNDLLIVGTTVGSFDVAAGQMSGGAGDDRLVGNGQIDAIHGDAGNDTIEGGGGNDSLYGGAGNDVLQGRWNNAAMLFGGEGDDTLYSGGMGNQLHGDDGNDTLYGSDDAEPLRGGAGNDLLLGGGGDDTLDGGPGDDTMRGDAGNDRFTDNVGVDIVEGGEGDDVFMWNGLGTRTFAGGGGLNRLEIAFAGAGGIDYTDAAVTLTNTSAATTVFDNSGGPGSRVRRTGSAVLSAIGHVTVLGTAGPDVLDARQASYPTHLHGHDGDDDLYGGGASDRLEGGIGSDWLEGGNGDDALYGGPGDDDLNGGFGSDSLLDTQGNDRNLSPDSDPMFRITTRPLTDAELGRTGKLIAFLEADALLSLVGPSGGGIQFGGPWASSIDTAGNEVFKATGSTVTLKTALGDIPIPNLPSFPITVVTRPDAYRNSGEFSTFTLGGGSGIPLGLRNPLSPLGNLANQFGIEADLPGDSFGIALGSELGSLNLPLANGIPYFYAQRNTNPGIKYGGFSATAGFLNVAFAFDPSDPSLFIRAGGFAFGGSLKGYIPFVPDSVPKYLSDRGVTAGQVVGYGNLFGEGSVDLGQIPVTLGGEVVVGLNTSRNGAPLGIGWSEPARFMRGQVSLGTLFDTAMSNVFVGMNGIVGVGYSKAGFDLSVDIGQGSMVHRHGATAFRAEPTDPFAGTFLDGIIEPNVRGQADGYIDASGNFDLAMDFRHGDGGALGIGSAVKANGNLRFNNSGMSAALEVNALEFLGGGATVYLNGNIQSNGNFSFSTGWSTSFDAYVATLYASINVTLSHSFGNVGLSAHVAGGIDFGEWFIGVSYYRGGIDLSGTLDLRAGYSGFNISGSGSVTFRAQLWNAFTGYNDVLGFPWSISFGFSTSGFWIDLPNPLDYWGDLNVSW
jgi:Ca2+-binding RTX toxin-like protein